MEYLSLQKSAGKILRLSEAMRALARQQDWSQFARLESERQRSIEYLFRHPDMPGALEDVADILRKVVIIDQESISLGEEARRLLAEKLDANQSQSGISVYQKNATL